LIVVLLGAGPGCSLLDNRASLFSDGPAAPPDAAADLLSAVDLAARQDQALKTDLEIYPPQQEAGACPPACVNGCVDGVCVLDCTAGCACPKGQSCKIECKADSCSGTIDCSAGKSCVINCSENACNFPIDCGGAACTVACFKGSCNDPILCGAGGCKITCSDHSCQNLINCDKGRCEILCSGSSCRGHVDCSKACACSLSCNNWSCNKYKVKCPAGCSYTYSSGCSANSKYPWCDRC